MFNNQNGGTTPSNQRTNVNTTLQSFFGKDVMFTIALWNDKVSLSWTPALGQDANGTTRYDRDHRINTALSAKKVKSLVEKYDEILKKYMDGTEELPESGKSIAVWVGGNRNNGILPGLFIITLKKSSDTLRPVVLLSIAKNVSEMETTPENIITYTCQDTPVVVDYDPTNGGTPIEESVPAEFDIFMDILRHHIDTFGLTIHSKKYVDAMFPGRNTQNNQKFENPANNGFDPSIVGNEYELPFN